MLELWPVKDCGDIQARVTSRSTITLIPINHLPDNQHHRHVDQHHHCQGSESLTWLSVLKSSYHHDQHCDLVINQYQQHFWKKQDLLLFAAEMHFVIVLPSLY